MHHMARPLRIEYEGAVYHIISRGNRGEHIFAEDQDKEYFIETLQTAVEKYKIDLYAFCIMGNHYHLLLTAPQGELGKAMHYIGSAYGSFLRRQKGWVGHVFAGRYKSLCVEKEGYLLELSRYIHLNPVRAGLWKIRGDINGAVTDTTLGRKKDPAG
jgi:putative transposase